MTILDSVKGTVNTAVDTISSVAQTIVEKNRTNAKLNRLRLVMKSESELMNRAYIALGKIMYDSRKKGTEINDAECEKLLKVIDTSKAKIAKARECYRKIVNSSNDIFYGNPEVAPEVKKDDIVDITVACSNEGDYKSSPFKEEKPVENSPRLLPKKRQNPSILQTSATSRRSLRQSVKKDSPSPQIQTRQMTVKLLTVNFSDNVNT